MTVKLTYTTFLSLSVLGLFQWRNEAFGWCTCDRNGAPQANNCPVLRTVFFGYRNYDNKLAIAKSADKGHVTNLEPLPRIQALATPPPGPHSRHVRHLEAMPVEDPHHSDDAVKDAVCRSRADSRRSLHQLQLLAIRKFFDESEPNFKDKQGNTDEDIRIAIFNAVKMDISASILMTYHFFPTAPSNPRYLSVGSSDTNADQCCQDKQKVHGHPKKVIWPNIHPKYSESQVKHVKVINATGSNDAEWKWKAACQGAMEKPLTQVRRWCQSPSAYGEIPRHSSKVLKEEDLSSEKPNDFNSNPSGKEADLPSHTIERAFTDLSPLREAGYRRVMDAVKRFEINIEAASKSTSPDLAPILPTKKRMGLSRDNPVNRRVSHFAQSWNEESKSVTQSLSKYSLNLAENPYARKAQEGEGDQEEETNKHVDSASVQRIAETPSFDEERSTPPQHYRPVGGIDIYTTQGPKLMQEMKDRFRKKHGASYVESEPKCRPRLALQTDQPTLPKLEKSLDDVQGLIPLPTNLSSDLSHILPSVLRGRPRRPGRLPSRYASQLLPADNVSLNLATPMHERDELNKLFSIFQQPHSRESINSTEA
ncbi:unnamed protein product [Taenia asiatica]|uniref:DUF4378 domain-containing protein n=1 Tax=Taenia asiatica TaxID=60517 RepID=A0A0R3VTZ1_TAEAS|nr:unnamed protein product [Taenia asiatica]